MTEIKLPKRAKPSKALSRDGLRPKLNRAYIAQPNGHRELIASDAYVLARIRVGDDVPLGALAPEALKRIEKGDKHEVTDDGAIRFTDKDGTAIEHSAPDQRELPFAASMPTFEPKKHMVVQIGLNPDLLKNLADALGAERGVKIEIPIFEDGSQVPTGMRVTPLSVAHEAEGLLMPVRLNK